jgi:hypothetical protein
MVWHTITLAAITAAFFMATYTWRRFGDASCVLDSDSISMTTIDPQDSPRRLTVLASFPRRTVVRLTATTSRGAPAVAVQLDNATVIIVPTFAEETEWALSTMAHVYKVSADEIFHLDSAPGQWPPPPKPTRSPVRKPSAK